MSYEIQGKLVHKYPINEINPSFRKREFVIEHSENVSGREFTDYIRLQLTQERCGLLDKIDNGSEVAVTFRIRGRRWEKDGEPVYFTNLEAFRIQQSSQTPRTEPASHASDEPLEPFLPGGDDLPF